MGQIMNTIGKMFFVIVLLIGNAVASAGSNVYLKAFNHRNKSISKIPVGVPFELHIVVRGDCKVDKVLTKSLDKFVVSDLGVMRSIKNFNGKTDRSQAHRYSVRIDKVGNYVFGPIKVSTSEGELKSDQISMQVFESPADAIGDLPQAQLTINKRRFYVGERFGASVRFYFDEDIYGAQADLKSAVSGNFEIDVIKKPQHSYEMRGGEQVDFYEWEVDLVVNKSGKQMFPAVQIDFEQEDRHSPFAIFSSRKLKKMFTNSIELEVLDLPKADKPVPGIGLFTSFEAKVDNHKIKDDRGALLRLKLKGAGNWSKIKFDIKGVPGGLRIYPSKDYFEGSDEKSFEFVVQGLKSGEYEIPVQSFVYFDIKDEKYVTLKTKPVTLSVDVSGIKKLADKKEKIEKVAEQEAAPEILPILVSGNLYANKTYSLPIWFFLILCITPLLILVGIYFKDNFRKNRKHSLDYYLSELSGLEKQNAPSKLYRLFIKFFSKLDGVEQVDVASVASALESMGVQRAEVTKFKHFMDDAMAAAFAKNHNLQAKKLFEDSKYWLEFLGGVFKI